MSQPSENMKQLLEQLATEDADLMDPTLMLPQYGRTFVAMYMDKWNRRLPQVATARTVIQDEKPARWIVPENDKGTDAILYIHGGGWSFCSPSTHESFARRLAIACACPILMPAYRLAPEYPWPAGLLDVMSAWSSAQTSERRWSISGESAGANLALAAILRMIREKVPLPFSGLLFYGAYGADFNSESYLSFAEGPRLSRSQMIRYWDWYAHEELRIDPEVAPLVASDSSLELLPPLYLNSAALDPLLSDTEQLVARLRAIGRADVYHCVDGVIHGFMQMGNSLREARTAFKNCGAAFLHFSA